MSYQALIVGAGPAGCVAARRLAAAGIRVALIAGATRSGLEGLSARSVALLAEEGLDGGAGALIRGPLARRGRWGERTVSGSEALIERRELSAALRAAAARAGAAVREDVVIGLERRAPGWRIRLRGGAALEALHVIDARGRRGAERRGPLLLAVGRPFRIDAGRAPAGLLEGTRIEPGARSWCWWALHGTALWVQVVGRPRTHSHPAEWLGAAAAECPALGALLTAAAPDGAAVARPAHARLAVGAPGELSRWRVGDAAAALDPLSGQGVYEALRGARLLATALESVLAGSDAALAQRFVRERQQAAWSAGVRAAADFYRENAGRGAFWAETARSYEQLLPSGAPSAPSIERRPVLDRGRILEREVIVTAQHPRGVWRVAGVPLASLKGYLESQPQATLAAAAAALERPPRAVAAAIDWLQQTGMVAQPSGPRTSLGG